MVDLIPLIPQSQTHFPPESVTILILCMLKTLLSLYKCFFLKLAFILFHKVLYNSSPFHKTQHNNFLFFSFIQSYKGYYITWVELSVQPFLKCSAYYVADLIPLIADSFLTPPPPPPPAWFSSLQTLLTNQNFHIAKYFSVICFPYLFHSLVYQTL